MATRSSSRLLSHFPTEMLFIPLSPSMFPSALILPVSEDFLNDSRDSSVSALGPGGRLLCHPYLPTCHLCPSCLLLLISLSLVFLLSLLSLSLSDGAYFPVSLYDW